MERLAINIIGEINEAQLLSVMEQIKEAREKIQKDLDYIEEFNKVATKENHMTPDPVIVNISSGGGSVVYGNAIIEELRTLKVPIITRCLGFAGSMAYSIFVQGDYRIMGEGSALMYHGCSNVHRGTLNQNQTSLEFDLKLESLNDLNIIQRTEITQEKLNYYKERSKDWFMFKQEAIENNSVTHDCSIEELIDIIKQDWLDSKNETEETREILDKLQAEEELLAEIVETSTKS